MELGPTAKMGQGMTQLSSRGRAITPCSQGVHGRLAPCGFLETP
jgi:hypothetical protein